MGRRDALDLFVNAKAFAALSPEYKAIVETAAAYAHTDTQAKYDIRNPAALKRLVAGGARLFPFPKDVLAAAFKETLSLCSDISARNPAWKKVYEDMASVRRDTSLWFRFAESGFDNFMQTRKF